MTLPLFDDTPAFDRSGLAGRLPALATENIWIGTSSWKYPGWLDQMYSRDRYPTRGRFSQKRFAAAPGEALRALIRRMREERRAALIFVNNRFEGNAPTTIQAIAE